MNQDQASRMAEEAGAAIFEKDGHFGNYQAGSVLFSPAEWVRFCAALVKLTEGQEEPVYHLRSYGDVSKSDLEAYTARSQQEERTAAWNAATDKVTLASVPQEPVRKWAVFCAGCSKEWSVPYQHPGKSICAECETKLHTMLAASPSPAPAVQDAAKPERTLLEQYDREQQPGYRDGYEDGRHKGYDVGLRHGAERAAKPDPKTFVKRVGDGFVKQPDGSYAKPETQGERAELIRLAQVAIHECPGHLSQDWQVAAIRVCKGLPALLSAGPERVEPLDQKGGHAD